MRRRSARRAEESMRAWRRPAIPSPTARRPSRERTAPPSAARCATHRKEGRIPSPRRPRLPTNEQANRTLGHGRRARRELTLNARSSAPHTGEREVTMSIAEPALQAEIDAASAYEQPFVPALFQQWAPRIAVAARLQPGQRVLDVACGTGVLAREATSRVGPAGFVAGVDSNRGMVTVASRLEPRVQWRLGTAETLPFPDASFDAVLSQFGLMFFSDRARALREMLRVLVPGGQ